MAKRAIPVRVHVFVELLQAVGRLRVDPLATYDDVAGLCYATASELIGGDETLVCAFASRAAALLHLRAQTRQESTLWERGAVVVAATIDHQLFQRFAADWFLLVVSNAQCVSAQPSFEPLERERVYPFDDPNSRLDWRAGDSGGISRDYFSIRTSSATLPFSTLGLVRASSDGETWGCVLRAKNFLSATMRRGTIHRSAVIVEMSDGNTNPQSQRARLFGQQRLYVSGG